MVVALTIRIAIIKTVSQTLRLVVLISILLGIGGVCRFREYVRTFASPLAAFIRLNGLLEPKAFLKGNCLILLAVS